MDASKHIYDNVYKNIFFFHDKSSSFIAWVCPLLKPITLQENQYLFFDGDDINSMFFNEKGSIGYVLPKYSNVKFIDIPSGC